MDFNKRLILITGASSGIGAALVRQLSKQSCRIAMIGRNSENLNRTKRESYNQAEIREYIFDLMKTENIPELIANIEQDFSQTVDILINVAGCAVIGNISDIPLEEYERVFRINYFAALGLIKGVIENMKQKRQGLIVNIVSGVGLRGLPAVSAYCSSKAAFISLTESLRVELTPYHIKVISFSPGPVETRFVQNQRRYGACQQDFIAKKMKPVEEVVKNLMYAIENQVRHTETSINARISKWLNYFAPKLLDRILFSFSKQSIEQARPKRIVDAHAYFDKSRMQIEDYLHLQDRYDIQRIVLSPPSVQGYEPEKSRYMYWIQRKLLWNDELRPIAKKLMSSFYGKEGELRGIWRLFTAKKKFFVKVIIPDNDNLEKLIQTEPERLNMWYWVNPKHSPPLETVYKKLTQKYIVGLKLHAYWHEFSLQEAEKFFYLCQELNRPVYLILGFDDTSSISYVIKTFPNLKVVLGYGGFPYFRKVWKEIRGNLNFYIDFTSIHIDRNIIQDALKFLGPNQCIFGTDCPRNFYTKEGNFDYKKMFDRVINRALSQSQLDEIFYQNFERVV